MKLGLAKAPLTVQKKSPKGSASKIQPSETIIHLVLLKSIMKEGIKPGNRHHVTGKTNNYEFQVLPWEEMQAMAGYWEHLGIVVTYRSQSKSINK
ncbi:MAG: hypothetical protein FWG14_11320 [Peptococcaceae bacterium]|nr:hypothetical protein [Peptococcaceae bacterium]